MSQSFAFYHARAEEDAAQARTATLDNVRERLQRSEKTWRGLAEQARQVAENREKAESEKAAERAAAEAEASQRSDGEGQTA